MFASVFSLLFWQFMFLWSFSTIASAHESFSCLFHTTLKRWIRALASFSNAWNVLVHDMRAVSVCAWVEQWFAYCTDYMLELHRCSMYCSNIFTSLSTSEQYRQLHLLRLTYWRFRQREYYEKFRWMASFDFSVFDFRKSLEIRLHFAKLILMAKVANKRRDFILYIQYILFSC